MAETVSVRIKIDDDGSFKRVEVDASDLKEVVGKVTAEVNKLNDEIVNYSQAAQAAGALKEAMNGIYGVLSNLAEGYNDDMVALAKLTNNMRNTMAASEEQVAKIEELCDAQERLGVIEKDAQLTGAQELATYLELTSSLETLIPVMNDMAAQQIGIGASGESVAQIASMLGKVMNGQVEALSRYGYKFSEAQKQILQYGEESERAAVLAEVVSEAVGGMNETMRQTDAGAMFEAKVAIDGLKDALGSVVSKAMPVISSISQIVTAGASLPQLNASLKSLSTYFNLTAIKSANATLYLKMQAAAQRLLAAAGIQAAAGTAVLNVAVVALYGALTMGIGALIAGIVSAFSALSASGENAAEKVNVLKDAEDAYKRTSSDMRAELAMQIVQIEEIIKKKGDEQSKVAELNSKYSEVFGTYRTLSDWYDVLVNKSTAYCRQLGYQAQMETIAKQIAEKEIERTQAQSNADSLRSSGKAYELKDRLDANNRYVTVSVDTKEYAAAKETVKRLDEEIGQLRETWDIAVDGMKSAQEELGKSLDAAGAKIPWQKQNLTELTKAIEEQKKRVQDLAGINDAEAASEARVLAAMQQRQKTLQKQYGLETSSGSGKDRNKYNGDTEIANPATYKELSNNIKYYTEQLENANIKDTEAISLLTRKITSLKEQQRLLDAAQSLASRPAELKSLQDIDAEIEYQTALRKKASADEIAGIDAAIRSLQRQKEFYGYTAPGLDSVSQIDSYDELNRALSYYSARLKTAGAAERTEIQSVIDALNEKKEAMEDADRSVGSIGTLNTYKALDDAISSYSKKLQTAGDGERAEIQATIDALNEKKNAMERAASIPAMQREVVRLDGITDRQKLAVELDLIGLEGVRSQIKSLQKMLDDTSNPLGDKDRKQVERIIASYKGYENILKKSMKTGDKVTKTMGGLSSLMGNMSKVVGEGAAGWLTYGANVLTAVAEALPALASVIGGNIAQAFSGAAAQSQTVPFPLNIVALAVSMAAVTAAVMSIPKFADGGLAYGPTLGLFGEYPGAAGNPEVVAPLDRLKTLIGDTGSTGGEVVFRIEGRNLVGILNKENRRKGRIR